MIPLIYAIKNAKVGKVEQMALATLDGLRDEFMPYVFAPEGAVIEEAQKLGFFAQPFSNITNFTFKLWLCFAANQELNFITTDPKFSYSIILLNFFYRRKITHLLLLGEDAIETHDFSKTSRLNNHDVTFVAHSKTIREKLIAHGTRQERIRVIENFLPEKLKETLPRRKPFKNESIKRVTVISKKDRDKNLDLLFAAIDSNPALNALEFKIYAGEAEVENLRKRAARNDRNILFAGAGENISKGLSESDLYLHLCPHESTDLTILEAMAADVPVLVPESENVTIITNNINGFSFRADDAKALAGCLKKVSKTSPDSLNAIAKGGRYLLNIRFSSEHGVERFRRLLHEQKVPDVDLTRGKLIL